MAACLYVHGPADIGTRVLTQQVLPTQLLPPGFSKLLSYGRKHEA